MSKKRELVTFGIAFAATILIGLISRENPTTNPGRLLSTNYSTTSIRTNNVQAFCSDKSRTALIDPSQQTAANYYSGIMDSMFSLDGYPSKNI